MSSHNPSTIHRVAARTAVPVLAALSVLAFGGCEQAGERSTAPSTSNIGTPSFTVGSGITVTPLASGTIDPFHIHSEYQGHRVEMKGHDPSVIVSNSAVLAPSGTTGWHTHSGPVLVIVKAGTFTMYMANDPACQPIVFPAGTAFIEPGGLNDVHIGRNEGATNVEWVATLILPVGVPGRIDAPDPGNCP